MTSPLINNLELLMLISIVLAANSVLCLKQNKLSNKFFEFHIFILSLSRREPKDYFSYRKEVGLSSLRYSFFTLGSFFLAYAVKNFGLSYKVLYLNLIASLFLIIHNEKKVNKLRK